MNTKPKMKKIFQSLLCHVNYFSIKPGMVQIGAGSLYLVLHHFVLGRIEHQTNMSAKPVSLYNLLMPKSWIMMYRDRKLGQGIVAQKIE